MHGTGTTLIALVLTAARSSIAQDARSPTFKAALTPPQCVQSVPQTGVTHGGDEQANLCSSSGKVGADDEGGGRGSPLRVRAYADKHVDQATVGPALRMAGHLLAAAALPVEWRVCDAAASCPAEDARAAAIVVILSSRGRQNGRENCGVAVQGTPGSGGTVLVSVPCVAGVAFRLARRAGTGTHPLLAMPRHDDVVGAIVAHEIGHLLGVSHARSGLMRATLEADDIIALRRGKLSFSAADSRTMRIATLSTAGSPTLMGKVIRRDPSPP